MQTLAITNQKGGVAKTTTAQAIGDYLQRQGASVLYVDLDPQGNLSYSLGASGGAFEALLDPKKVKNYITRTERGDIIASAEGLAGADAAITSVGKEYRLREALEGLEYDYCIIDTPPALGILSINALTACQDVVIPVQADIYSLQGLAQISQTLGAVKQYTNSGLSVRGILITRHNGRTIVRRDIADLLERCAADMGTKVFKTKIRECTAVVEAQANQASIFEYAPRSNAAKDYTEFMQEMLGGKGNGR